MKAKPPKGSLLLGALLLPLVAVDKAERLADRVAKWGMRKAEEKLFDADNDKPLPTVTEQEMLKRDIQTLRESLSLDYRDLALLKLTKEQVEGIREHIRLCLEDLKNLQGK